MPTLQNMGSVHLFGTSSTSHPIHPLQAYTTSQQDLPPIGLRAKTASLRIWPCKQALWKSSFPMTCYSHRECRGRAKTRCPATLCWDLQMEFATLYLCKPRAPMQLCECLAIMLRVYLRDNLHHLSKKPYTRRMYCLSLRADFTEIICGRLSIQTNNLTPVTPSLWQFIFLYENVQEQNRTNCCNKQGYTLTASQAGGHTDKSIN